MCRNPSLIRFRNSHARAVEHAYALPINVVQKWLPSGRDVFGTFGPLEPKFFQDSAVYSFRKNIRNPFLVFVFQEPHRFFDIWVAIVE